ncbi:hypothetical protein FACS1894123_01530 [Bacteroidia bacterium]|nr:hypothetical protein FACS1894123_01530 [Bacteroidia bacterium]
MNHLLINKLQQVNPKASELSSILGKENIPFHPVSHVNWTEYPYKPDVTFRIAHTGKHILLNYKVEESDITAVCDSDNGKIWEDSCVEFFISFNDDNFYYNIECNCIGKILVGTGAGKNNRSHVSANLLNRIDRWSSLGDLPVKNLSGKWELSLIIPIEVFLQNSGITEFTNIQAKGNFYKCGDNLKTPHFLSWNSIQSESPNFHLPAFFGALLFE